MHKVAYASTRIIGPRTLREDPRASSPAQEDMMTMSGLDKWYSYMKSHDTAALWDFM